MDRKGSFWNFDLIIILIYLPLIILWNFLGKTKSWWLGGVIGAGIGLVICLIKGFVLSNFILFGILAAIGLIFDFLASKFYGKISKGGNHFWFFGGRIAVAVQVLAVEDSAAAVLAEEEAAGSGKISLIGLIGFIGLILWKKAVHN